MTHAAPALTHGLLAEFADAAALVRAAEEMHRRGYRRLDAQTPFPVEGLAEAMGFERTRMPLVVLIGAVLGCLGGFGMQWWISVIEYPLNIGGRPLNSWPAFIPVTFEMTILGGALFAVLGMLGLNGLPRPNHPLFNIPEFVHATSDGFFLEVRADDPAYHELSTKQTLVNLGARQVWSVPLD